MAEIVDKKDAGKAPMSFLGALREELADVARVLDWGNRKYKNLTNYRTVVDGRKRFIDAGLRHLMAAADGKDRDEETGEWHLAHAACCCLMALWHSKAPDLQDDRVL